MKTPLNGLRSALVLASMLLACRGLQARELPVASANDNETTDRPATQLITVRETYDFAFTPEHPGLLLLQGVVPGDGFVATQMLKIVPR